MSHAEGTVHQLPQRSFIGYFEYDGTTDYALCAIFTTREELRVGWRTEQNHRECSCQESVRAAVELYADYGSGIVWESEACLRCMTITGKRNRRIEEPKWSCFGFDAEEEDR
jgi:hypothetical protein